ncbi:MAG: protein kinase [Myxococcota bacterium]|nr:protein kinase [Myxococcota bacterium]
MVPSSPPQVGSVLDGRYELTEFIAEGGMGRVYKGIQRTLDRVVAIKLLKHFSERSSEFQKRFFLEASLCARLGHPNTIRIFDYGCHQNDTWYIVMEYLEGAALSQILGEEGPLSPGRAISILKQVCVALIEAHGAGLVHRDLKPSNLFVVDDGMGGEFIKILDFGIVTQMSVADEIDSNDSVLGSPPYMPPEQGHGREVDGRSDLYALGAILFELLTGRTPFIGNTVLEIIAKHITQPIPRLTAANATIEVDPAVEAIIRKAMEKSPEDRYADAREMLEALVLAEAGLKLDIAATAPSLGSELTLEAETRVLAPGEDWSEAPTLPATEESPNPLLDVQLEGYEAFIDLNCPYCYALFERVTQWGLADQIRWCMVEHASHVLDGGFDLRQEEMLSNEVFEVHHRAPDIDLNLPVDRCRSTLATRMLAIVHRLFPEKENVVRRSTYLALWRHGLDIGDVQVLREILEAQDLPAELLSECDTPPDELEAWQSAWEDGDYDFSIPVLTHRPSGRVLIGLADQSTLSEFLLGDRFRVIDHTVCFYQRKPSILLCGWLSHLWPLLQDIKEQVEVIQAPTARRASEMLGERAPPDLLLVEDEHINQDELEPLGRLARSRSVPWLVATRTPDSEREISALSSGAIEYLSAQEDSITSRTRLRRLLEDRFRLSREARFSPTDQLTRLPTRKVLLERMEEEWGRKDNRDEAMSLVLLNLDGFKAYNKTHGYLSGDEVLTDLARKLRREFAGPGRQLARFGGNEFALLLPQTDRPSADRVAQGMVQLVADAQIENRAKEEGGWLTARTGVHTAVPAVSTSVYVLVDAAYRDLQAGR